MNRLKLKRLDSELTQEQLRVTAKVSPNTIVYLEKGQIDSVSVKTLKKIAEALNSTVQELFFSDEE